MTQKATLRPNQWQAVSWLLLGRSAQETADNVNVTKRTVMRWLREPAFRDALRQAQSQRLDELARALACRGEVAIAVLTEAMTASKSVNARLRAAGLVLDYALRYASRQLEERVSEAEERLANIEEVLREQASSC